MKFFILNNKGLEKLKKEECIKNYKEYEYWIHGYAIPENVFKKLNISRKYILYEIDEEYLIAEPDANIEFAYDFCKEFKDGSIVVDIASGFGYVPAILSKRFFVIAIDLNYGKKIVKSGDRYFIKDTNIEVYINPEEYSLKNYADFSRFVWESLGGNLSNIRLIISDINLIPIKTSSVDYVSSFFGLNHVKHWKKAVHETFRILKKGGYFISTIYKEILEKFPIKNSYEWVKDIGINIISLDEYLECINKLFEIEFVEDKKLYYKIVAKKL